MSDSLPVILFLLPFLTAIVLPMIGHRKPSWCGPIASTVVAAMCAVAIFNLVGVLSYGETRYAFGGWSIREGVPSYPLGIEWVNDLLASVMLMTLTSVALLCVVFAKAWDPAAPGHRWALHHTLVLILISGLVGIVLAGDLFNVFVFFEVAALSAYALVGVAGGKALVAAFRYLIIGTLGSSFYLLGVVFLYAATGTLNMGDMADQLINDPTLLTNKAMIGGTTFLFFGFGIKMALFPLHGWLPGAYCRAPDVVSPLLAGLMTKVALYAWIRILFWVLAAGVNVGGVAEIVDGQRIGIGHVLGLFGFLGAVGTVAGALLALAQKDIKRMFAYGGVSHIGLIAIGISSGTSTGAVGSIFYLINDAFMQAGAFFIAAAAMSFYSTRSVNDASSLRRSPWLIASLIVLAMSMIGVPPTGGFFGKWQILLGALETGNYLAVAAIVIATLLTMAYFQRLFVSVFRDPPGEGEAQTSAEALPWSIRIGLLGVMVVLVVSGLVVDPVVTCIRDIAASGGF